MELGRAVERAEPWSRAVEPGCAVEPGGALKAGCAEPVEPYWGSGPAGASNGAEPNRADRWMVLNRAESWVVLNPGQMPGARSTSGRRELWVA